MSLQNFTIRFRQTYLFQALKHATIARGPVHRNKMRRTKEVEHGFGIMKTRHALMQHAFSWNRILLSFSCFRMLFCDKPVSTLSQHASEQHAFSWKRNLLSFSCFRMLYCDKPVSTLSQHALAHMFCAVFMLASAYATDRFCPSLPGSSWMSWVEVESRLKDQGLRMVRLRISEDRCYDVMVIDGHGQNHTLLINPVTAKIIVQRKL